MENTWNVDMQNLCPIDLMPRCCCAVPFGAVIVAARPSWLVALKVTWSITGIVSCHILSYLVISCHILSKVSAPQWRNRTNINLKATSQHVNISRASQAHCVCALLRKQSQMFRKYSYSLDSDMFRCQNPWRLTLIFWYCWQHGRLLQCLASSVVTRCDSFQLPKVLTTPPRRATGAAPWPPWQMVQIMQIHLSTKHTSNSRYNLICNLYVTISES